MRKPSLCAQFFEFSEQRFLFTGHICGDFNEDFYNLIAAAVTPNVGDTFTFEAENATVLCATGYLDFFGIIKCRHFDGRAECGLNKGDGYPAEDVIAVTGEKLMFLDLDEYIKITGRAAAIACFSFTA